jgi:flagellar biosynthesis/type III secretory pathway chaperone
MTMETNEANRLDLVLDELQELLDEETAALRKLDHRTLDVLTARKVDLLSEVGQLSRREARATTRQKLVRIRKLALENQLLMIHARDLVRGALETWGPGYVGTTGSLLETRG